MAQALLHYGIGLAACREGAPVDWRYVALRMAETLLDRDPTHAAARPSKEPRPS